MSHSERSEGWDSSSKESLGLCSVFALATLVIPTVAQRSGGTSRWTLPLLLLLGDAMTACTGQFHFTLSS
ncbi:MAG: hypothetical protein JWN45_1450 [Acidobacteriaceae bacterium]|nr:hypothetical protein [Acidobacteriaceae bacterium]